MNIRYASLCSGIEAASRGAGNQPKNAQTARDTKPLATVWLCR